MVVASTASFMAGRLSSSPPSPPRPCDVMEETWTHKFARHPRPETRSRRVVASAGARTPEQISAYNLAATTATEVKPLAAAQPAAPKLQPNQPKPNPKPKPKSAKAFDITSKQPGIVKPTGFWDPWGLAKGKSADKLRWFQEAELKHGRIAMLACVGVIWAEQSHGMFGSLMTDEAASGPAFESWKAVPGGFWPLLLWWIWGVEAKMVEQLENPDGQTELVFKDNYPLGDLKFDPLRLKNADIDKLRRQKTQELSNGRLAMLGIAGMWAQEAVTGKTIFTPPPMASAAEFQSLVIEMTQVLKDMDVL